MTSDKRILITTVYNNKEIKYDYFGANSRNTMFRLSSPRVESLGLRFLKQNIPEIEILEYPSFEKYKRIIKNNNWNTVGFSFYLNETPEILQMIDYAKKHGVKEIWGGNYGALTDEIKDYFDWTCFGYGEEEIAKKIGKKIDEIIHPPLIGYIGTAIGLKLSSYGYLSVNRGCNKRCSFCQTPLFCKKPTKLSISSIEKVLEYYRKVGVDQIVIPDENFGVFSKHSKKVVQLLGEFGFYWYPITRADTINKNLDIWLDNGLGGVLIGIETFHQKTMDDINKKEKVEEIRQAVESLQKENRFVIGAYIIGFENETSESIKKSAEELANLKLDLTQVCVLMPLPKTPLWAYLEEKYGIFEKDWHKYNAKHLVWNHPHITKEQMKKLLDFTLKKSYPLITPIRTTLRMIKRNSTENHGFINGSLYMGRQLIHSNNFPYSENVYM